MAFGLLRSCSDLVSGTITLFIVFAASSCYGQEGRNEEPYVVDHRYPLIITDEAFGDQDTQFGMSVALSSGPQGDYNQRPSGWVFIGAPSSDSSDPTYKKINKTGVLWRCSLGRQRGDTCEILNIDPSTVRQKSGSPSKEDEGDSWVGGSVEIQDGRLVACGPRWTRGERTFMNGLCYWLKGTSSSKSFQSEAFLIDKNPKTYYHRLFPFFWKDDSSKNQNFEITYHGKSRNDPNYELALGQAGFSLHMLKNKTSGSELLLGAPGARSWSGAVVRYVDNPSKAIGDNFRSNRDPNDPTYSEYVIGFRGTKENYEQNHWFEYFGYAVTSGRYLNNGEVFYAGGAPRGNNLTGEVVLFDIPSPKTEKNANTDDTVKRSIVPRLVIRPRSTDIGSYFGSVLLTLDIDGDGVDELLVGAPMFTVVKFRRKRSLDAAQPYSSFRDKDGNVVESQKWFGDHGSVFVYSFGDTKNASSKDSMKITQTQVLNGSLTPASRFGSAISYLRTTDLYIVVGAPYENHGRGVVYIYLAEKLLGPYVQKISAEDISSSLHGFGCSISLPMDIDENATPDLAIGAYRSKQVVIIRARPSIRLNGKVTFPSLEKSKDKLPRGAREIKLKVCFKVLKEFGKVTSELGIWTRITVDSRLSISSKILDAGPGFYSEISKSIIVYDTNVLTTTSSSNCQEITATIDEPEKIEDENTDPNPLTIVHDLWYNETSQPGQHILNYQATSGSQKVVNSTSTNGSDFSSFGSQKPYPVSSMSDTYSIEISPNDCQFDVCEPQLNITAEWFHPADSLRKTPITEFNIGLFRHLILRVNVSNFRETAIKPRFTIEWDRKGITASKTGGEFWLLNPRSCKEINLTMGYAYNCNFTHNLLRNRTVSRDFLLDTKDLFASTPKDVLTVSLTVYPLGQKDEFKAVLDHKLILNADSKVTLVGSRNNDTLRNPFDYNCTEFRFGKTTDPEKGGTQKLKLFSAWRQIYTAHIVGPSNVETIRLSFKLPWGRKIGSSKPKPVVLIHQNPKTMKENVHCELPEGQGQFYIIENSRPDEPDSETPVDFVMPRLQGINVRPKYSRSDELPNVHLERRRRRETGSIDSTARKPIIKSPKFEITDDMIYINCNDEMSEFVCMEVLCTATNVRGWSSVDVAFDFHLVKDVIDELMANGKEEVLVESIGSAKIFETSPEMKNYHMDMDVSQTWFVQARGTVDFWIYIVAIVFGILLLTLIVFILYKCGFFKRETKMELEYLRAEARKSMKRGSFSEGEKNTYESQELVDNIELHGTEPEILQGEGSQSVVERL